MRILVVSDLHAYQRTATSGKPSHICIDDTDDSPTQHPLAGLRDLLTTQNINIDLLLCPGDLGDKASSAGIQYAWQKLEEIGRQLGSPLMVSASGNHDLDSRFIANAYDPRSVLQNLRPEFPVDDATRANEYWARHFTSISKAGLRIVVVDSCAFHGGAVDEIEHGRVSRDTLDRLRSKLVNDPAPEPLNILLCHHHPQQQMELGGELDFIRNGQGLLDLLGSDLFGCWLVVHGHKHLPKLTYAAGGSTSPVVLSAGSFSASLYGELGTRARNQFHIITLNEVGEGPYGTVHSWEWAFGSGWVKASPGSGLPYKCGFGYRGSLELLANSIRSSLRGPKERWSYIESVLPEVLHLIPQDMASLRRKLKRMHGLIVVDSDNEPQEIGIAL